MSVPATTIVPYQVVGPERRLRGKTEREQEHSARSRAQPTYLSRQSDRVQACHFPQRQPASKSAKHRNSRLFPAAKKRKNSQQARGGHGKPFYVCLRRHVAIKGATNTVRILLRVAVRTQKNMQTVFTSLLRCSHRFFNCQCQFQFRFFVSGFTVSIPSCYPYLSLSYAPWSEGGCLSSSKLRSTDSVNPRAVLSRVRPRYRLYSKHRDRRCWTGPGIGIRVSFRTLEGSAAFQNNEGTGECGRVEASAP